MDLITEIKEYTGLQFCLALKRFVLGFLKLKNKPKQIHPARPHSLTRRGKSILVMIALAKNNLFKYTPANQLSVATVKWI